MFVFVVLVIYIFFQKIIGEQITSKLNFKKMHQCSVFLLICFSFILIFGFQVSSNEFSGCKSKKNLLYNLLEAALACLNNPDKCKGGNIVFQGKLYFYFM